MKANGLTKKDLMIGDWVYNTHNQKPEQVCEILERMVMLDYNDLYEYDEIEPIPLTLEILEKNGWMYIAEDNVFYPENLKGELPWIYYITDGSNEVFRMKDFCNLQYVHQLQHALKLCEIEKNIEL